MRIAPIPIRRLIGCLILGIWLSFSFSSATAAVVISELMASNTRTLPDEDGAFPDWIELHNTGPEEISLEHWTLSDSLKTPASKRWNFPATPLPANGFLIVFASGKDRRIPGSPLHTSFQLNRAGDSIILRNPEGTIADNDFIQPFPPQVNDVSLGRGRESIDIPLIEDISPAQLIVPGSNVWDEDWFSPLFFPAGWSQGVGAWGYDNRSSTALPTLTRLRQTIRTTLFGKNTTVYWRVPFMVSEPAFLESLTLTVSYPDGFAAFLNGVECANDHRPATLAWNSAATEKRDWLSDGLPRHFELSGEALSTLRVGTNWLAIQGLASTSTNVAFILGATLTGARSLTSTNSLRYFTTPTPGRMNGLGTRKLGPIFSDPSPPPADPSPDQPIAVSTRLAPSFSAIKRAELRYRVMFGPEIALAMTDDGNTQDGDERDGIYGAVIPPNVAHPGEMIRWYCVAEDESGNMSRWPSFEESMRSPAYWGTMARTNDAQTLPSFHWFVDEENAKTASTLTGARCSVYGNGQLYDNVGVRIRGQLSLNWSKHNYKFDFNPGHLFEYDPSLPRVEEVNLNSTWSDKSYSRAVLAWESYREGGTPYCRSFPMRVYQNGTFFSVAIFVEQPDARWLTRQGLDPSGTLFKMNSTLENTAGVQKKIPRDGHLEELEDLVRSVAPSNPSRFADLLDQWDLASVINYLAITAVIHDNDCVGKNYFLHHDRNGSGLWRILPWDKDLTFGHNYQSRGGLSDDIWADYDRTNSLGTDHPLASPSHPLFGDRSHQKENGQWNRLTDLIYQSDPTRQMYLRRLRTVMDALLQSPDTPHSHLHYEQRIDSLMHAMRVDAALDRTISGNPAYGIPQDIATALKQLETDYLTKRRFHFYVRHNETNATRISNSARIPEPPGVDQLKLRFGQVDRLPESRNPQEEFLEIINPSAVAWDLSGWWIRGPITHVFPAGTVIPPAYSLFLCRDIRAFRDRRQGPRGHLGLFAQGNYQGSLGSAATVIELMSENLVIARLPLDDQRSSAQRFLRVQRIQYHPSESLASSAELEHIELHHVGPEPLDLDGIRFTRGIHFSFATGTVHRLPAPPDSSARERSVILVKNRKLFTGHYGEDPRIAGEYAGHLSNAGDLLRLEDSRGQVIQEFTYHPETFPLTDGVGFSLIHPRDAPVESWMDASTWRMGAWEGLPGLLNTYAEAPLIRSSARIREIVLPESDDSSGSIAIDVREETNIEGWFLSDSIQQPRKFRIPGPIIARSNAPTILPAELWNRPSAASPGFQLSLEGGELFLFSADALGKLTGYYHAARYGRGLRGDGFLRREGDDQQEFWIRESTPALSPGFETVAAADLVISEIHYHPAPKVTNHDNREDEYLELHNISGSTLLLFNSSTPTLAWRIRGSVEMELPQSTRIPPDGYLILVSFDPSREPQRAQGFRSRFDIPSQVPVLGPWLGFLPNSPGELVLEAPALDHGQARHVEVDRVHYSDQAPWPAAADGMGASLSRQQDRAGAMSSAAWTATAPGPGRSQDNTPPPQVLISPSSREVSAFTDVLVGILAGPDRDLQFQWRQNGVPIPGAFRSLLSLPRIEPSAAGQYDVLVMGRGGVVFSDRGTITVAQPPILYDVPALPLAIAGTNYSLSIGAVGEGPLRYQWRKNGSLLPGKTNVALLLPNVGADSEGRYSVVVSDSRGSAESPETSVRVVYPPQLLWPPESQMLNIGETIRLRVTLTGTPPFGYLWRKDGLNLRRPSQDSLTLANAQLTNAGVYSILVSNIATARFVALPQKASVLVLGDTDGDGMPDIWELTYQFRYDDPSDANLDSDFDGMTNLQEYRAGTNPRDPSDVLHLNLAVGSTLSGGKALLQFNTISNRTYTLQTSDRLGTSWTSWMDLPAQQTNKDFSIPIDLRNGGTQKNYRLRIP